MSVPRRHQRPARRVHRRRDVASVVRVMRSWREASASTPSSTLRPRSPCRCRPARPQTERAPARACAAALRRRVHGGAGLSAIPPRRRRAGVSAARLLHRRPPGHGRPDARHQGHRPLSHVLPLREAGVAGRPWLRRLGAGCRCPFPSAGSRFPTADRRNCRNNPIPNFAQTGGRRRARSGTSGAAVDSASIP